MRKLFLLLAFTLSLSACAETDRDFLDKPDQYGLFVATTNLYFDIPLIIQRADTGERIAVEVKRYAGGSTGYLVHSLPPGRYYIYSYSPYKNVTIPLSFPEGFFDIQSNCFNYGGYYEFRSQTVRIGYKAIIGYKNITEVKDIEQLPPSIRDLAKGYGMCVASLGKSNYRLTDADSKASLPQN